jgi:hypothetical protein
MVTTQVIEVPTQGTQEYVDRIVDRFKAFRAMAPAGTLPYPMYLRQTDEDRIEVIWRNNPKERYDIDVTLTYLDEGPDGQDVVRLIEANTVLGVGCGPSNTPAPYNGIERANGTWVLVISLVPTLGPTPVVKGY